MADSEKPSCFTLLKRFFYYHWMGVFTILVPLALSPMIFLYPEKIEFRCMYLILVCCLLWLTECIPLYVTSLMPIFALPVMGLLDSDRTCQNYFKDTLVMFLGSLIVALSIEYCNLHKRLALKVILLVGCSPRRLHFGLICVTSFISMWISNSATTAMMMPIIAAVLDELDSNNVIVAYMDEEVEPPVEPGKKHPSKISMGFYLGAGYAASIGGCGTLIGTGTNLVFKGIYMERFPDTTDPIDFPRFMGYAFPLACVNTLLLFLCLEITHLGLFRPNSKVGIEVNKGAESADAVKTVVIQKYKELGPMNIHEYQVLCCFITMILLLFFRSPGIVPGWGDFFNAVKINTSSPVLVSALLLFLLPMSYTFCGNMSAEGPKTSVRERALMSWEFVNSNAPWGLVFLLGGGFALADASQNSGMAKLLGEALQILETWPPVLVQLAAITAAIVLTNFSANVPVCNILMPILMEIAVAIKMHPIMLAFPAGIACSMAFHLPVGTPPNAIVSFAAGIKAKYMVTAGILPTIFTIFTILINSQTMHYVIYPSRVYPDWATAAVPT